MEDLLPYAAREWLNLALRWFHVFAGIMWIGQTYFFTWLDHTLEKERQVWMVHSGGFYIVDKQKTPQLIADKTLHWFKWEAFFTWTSGLLLFALVYHAGGLMRDDSVMQLTAWQAAGISFGLIIAGWVVYDLIWISPLAKNETVGVIVSYIVLVAAIYGMTRIFAPRAAYMQIGAILGTNMALNVWKRILPAQRSLIGAVKAGGQPDMRLADIAKQRSKQNTFNIMPVVFIMLSNHFPVTTYGSDRNWIVLAALVLVGWAVAKVIRTR